jgi:hypothetical protein
MSELNEVMKIIDPVFGLYKHMGSVTRGSCCQSIFYRYRREAMNFTVKKLPRYSRALTGVAYNYWIEKLIALRLRMKNSWM